MTNEDFLQELNTKVDDLKALKSVSMSIDVYNDEVSSSKAKGMALVMNIVFALINEQEVDTDESTDKVILDFIETVKSNLKKPRKKKATKKKTRPKEKK